ncbi:hypothetical protein ANCCEY_05575 [Ancylostoma ceylanicum]|uniref:Uncharacterized protein n=1 Tax=Ancylostoma ceylanicum TaxID=53326 RepID=A0A0D6LZ46_9BILA|nr:hypothetical protein ANCCEY_05575 [Ancylostoma ceylanicum]
MFRPYFDFSPFERHPPQSSARLWQHVRAQVKKRVNYASRSWRTLFSQLIVPVLFVVLGMGVALPAISPATAPPIEISTAQFVNVSMSSILVPYQDFVSMPDYPYSNLTSRDSFLVTPTAAITQLFNPAGPGSVCAIEDGSLTWLDANQPNISKKTLDRKVDLTLFDTHCFGLSCKNCIRSGKLGDFIVPVTADSSDATCRCETKKFVEQCERFPQPNVTGVSISGSIPYEVSGFDLSAWTIESSQNANFGFGGVAFGFQNPNVPFDYGVDKHKFLRKLAVRHVTKVLFDNRAFHAQPIYLNLWHNTLLRAAVRQSGADVNPGAYAIRLTNYPLPSKKIMFSLEQICLGTSVYSSSATIQAFAVLMLLFGISSIPLIYVVGCNNIVLSGWDFPLSLKPLGKRDPPFLGDDMAFGIESNIPRIVLGLYQPVNRLFTMKFDML